VEKINAIWWNIKISLQKFVDMCGHELSTNLQNFTQKDLTKVKMFLKVLGGGGYFFWNTCMTWRVGLCRTCEIFGVSKFVISSLRHVEDKSFENLSVSSHKWIHIEEVIYHSIAIFFILTVTQPDSQSPSPRVCNPACCRPVSSRINWESCGRKSFFYPVLVFKVLRLSLKPG